MVQYLRMRNAMLLAGLEAAAGVEEVLSASTHAIRVSDVQVAYDIKEIAPNEYSGSLDEGEPILGGMKGNLSFNVYMKGSGVAETPPETGKLIKACGWAEVITSSAVPGSAEACGAGGSTTIAQLGASASSTAQLYRGMPAILSGEVAGTSFISNYGASKMATLTDLFAAIDADTSYQIPKNVLYKPASLSIPALTMNFFNDGLLVKFIGNRGNMSINLVSGEPGMLNFRFSGMFVSKTDASIPATPTFDNTVKPIFKAGKMLINRAEASVKNFRLDCGNTLTNPDNPNTQEGFDVAEIVGRKMRGNIDPSETLVATRNIMGDLRAGNKAIIHARFGNTAGNRIALTVPSAKYLNESPDGREGISTVNVPFAPTGEDAGAFLCFY